MSKVVDIRSYLETLVQATVSGYVKLSDSHQASDNPSLILTKGYSIGFSPGENVSDEWCPGTIPISRQFQLILTNVYTPNLDPDYRGSLEDSLMNDEFAIVGAIEKDVTLTGNAITSRFLFDNGLEYLIDDEKQFIIVVATISVIYEENT